jgi:hypothetical protein
VLRYHFDIEVKIILFLYININIFEVIFIVVKLSKMLPNYLKVQEEKMWNVKNKLKVRISIYTDVVLIYAPSHEKRPRSKLKLYSRRRSANSV